MKSRRHHVLHEAGESGSDLIADYKREIHVALVVVEIRSC